MSKEVDIIRVFDECSNELRQAITEHSGKSMCESTRLVLGALSILVSYYPELCTEERFDRTKMAFEEAISCIQDDIERGHDPDGDNNLYLNNIKHRYETLPWNKANAKG